MADELHVDVNEGVALLTIDRPNANNSLGGSLLRELLAVTTELEADDRVRVMVTTANVSSRAKLWSPGLDLSLLDGTLGPGTDADSLFFEGVMQGDYASLGISAQGRRIDPLGPGQWVLLMLRNFRKPAIAAINGAVAGGGIGWAGMHTYRIAGESVKFKAAFATLGLCPDLGASYFVTKLAGPNAAAEIFLRDRPFSARQAHDWGLVNQVVPDNQVVARSLEVAARMAALPPLGLRTAIRVLRGADVNSLEDQLALEWDCQRFALATEDAAAAYAALRTRTTGTYRGR
jgi:enoyl-CoA hydratase/carnithine racemase